MYLPSSIFAVIVHNKRQYRTGSYVSDKDVNHVAIVRMGSQKRHVCWCRSLDIRWRLDALLSEDGNLRLRQFALAVGLRLGFGYQIWPWPNYDVDRLLKEGHLASYLDILSSSRHTPGRKRGCVTRILVWLRFYLCFRECKRETMKWNITAVAARYEIKYVVGGNDNHVEQSYLNK